MMLAVDETDAEEEAEKEDEGSLRFEALKGIVMYCLAVRTWVLGLFN